MTANQLRTQLKEKLDAQAKLFEQYKAADGGYDLPPDAQKSVETIQGEVTDLDARIAVADANEAKAAEIAARQAKLSEPQRPAFLSGNGAPAQAKGETESRAEKFAQTGGFKGLGHFAHEVRKAGERPGIAASGALGEWRKGIVEDDAAYAALFGTTAKASGLNEFTDSEGGVLLPTQIAAGLWQRSLTDDFNMLSLPGITAIPVSGRDLKVMALNDKSRADGSRYGGVQGYWTAEAAEYTSSKPTFRDITLSLNKLTVLVYATDELLEDTSAAEMVINRAASGELRFKINDAMIRGSGVGMPLGFLNSPCKVTVTRGTSSHVTAVDLDAMYARRSKASGQGIVWLANQDVEPDLGNLAYTVSSASAVWAYMPGGTFGSETPKLKGKPCYYVEQCETLGTSGELIMLDPDAIAVAVKSTGIKGAVSMHLRFAYDETAFKFSMRMDARPYWETSLTRFKGANALSPIAVLS
jgi:HK97 family phage major capsid protein